MIDRGLIKWKPFNTCITQKEIIKELNEERNKEVFPALSEDQLYLIEEKIKDAYVLQTTVILEYYKSGKILTSVGTINSINFQEKKIYLNNKYVFFKQILKINY